MALRLRAKRRHRAAEWSLWKEGLERSRPRPKSPMAKSFYIIDGHAHIYRSYFAPFRDLTSPTGEPTKATYVFTQMLLNLIEQRKPDYLAMVIDKGGGEEP